MGERYGQDDPHTSYNMISKTQRSRLDDVPNPKDYIPVREVYLRETMMESLMKQPPKSDRAIYQYEDYLRKKWGCTEAIPDSFDPIKLEAALKSRFPSKSKHGESVETSKSISQRKEDESQNTPSESPHISADIYSCERNASHDSLSPGLVNQPLETDEQLGDDESEMAVDNLELLIDDITSAWLQSNLDATSRGGQTMPETSDRASTPRIGAGSKPPLSRSAFVEGGAVRGQAKPPEYFPFKSRVRRPSRSK